MKIGAKIVSRGCSVFDPHECFRGVVCCDMRTGVAKLSPRGEKCERSHGFLGVLVKCEILVSSLRAQVKLLFHTLKVVKIFVGKVEVEIFGAGW
jgi:hypothetical protein